LASPSLVPAEGAVHERILDETHRIWSDGLTRPRYAQYNAAQRLTRWGARHLARLALMDGHRLLASAKRYDLEVLLNGRVHSAVGIGAVFTPPELRGRGHGGQVVTAVLDAARADGASIGLLFSEIGTAYYERLGFRQIPLDDCDLFVRQGSGPPAIPMRTGDDRDLPFIAEIHAARAAAYRFALRYDADWLQYSIAKRRLLCGLGTPGTREVELLVVEEGTRPAAWVLLHVERPRQTGGRERWTVESCGDFDPSGAGVGAMRLARLARTPAAPVPEIRAWWPAGFDPPQMARRVRRSSGITMMARALRGDVVLEPPPDRSNAIYWHADAF
jgi:GNAT superfamily N-acetyltransferase